VKIAPGETVTLAIDVDTESEQDFRGSLSVSVTGYLADGSVAFSTNVKFHVNRDLGEGGV
jgi:hypothetical protein